MASAAIGPLGFGGRVAARHGDSRGVVAGKQPVRVAAVRKAGGDRGVLLARDEVVVVRPDVGDLVPARRVSASGIVLTTVSNALDPRDLAELPVDELGICYSELCKASRAARSAAHPLS